MIFKQFFEADTCTFSYLLGCNRTGRAVLIDPVASEADNYLQSLEQEALTLVYTVETHVHADHITASGFLRQRLGSKSAVHRDAGAPCADLLVTHGVLLQIGDLEFEVRHTPGHTNGCISLVMHDRVFTGDSLFINGCGRTDFQQGNAGTLHDSIHQQLFTLPGDTLVYPGHDYQGHTVSTIKQEMAINPRLGGHRNRDDFIRLMNELNLPYPKYIDEAMPANQACGQPHPARQG
ncbi:MBL fold metallo-hydrolase [Candidatus Woesearchaeota archaeon]|nr:MBL fold metallo-hydrolase [Candidatus Woesearchaeota archaeon]